MISIRLSKAQQAELIALDEGEVLELDYNGLQAYLTPSEYGNCELEGRTYEFDFYHPTKVRLVKKKN